MAQLIDFPSSNIPVRHPKWELVYAGKPITAGIARMVTEVTYTEKLNGEASELEVKIADDKKRWQGAWFPDKGDVVHLEIGYENETMLDCGDFQIDELELTGAPDEFHLRCISAAITTAARTPTSVGYENQTLLSIATTIAAKHGWTISGLPATINVSYGRVTQNKETDLGFLRRLANGANYYFTVQGNNLIFWSRPAAEALPAVLQITRTMLTRFSFKSKAHQIYKAARVSYLNPATKQLVTQSVAANPAVPNGDTLDITDRAENAQQAQIKAQAALHDLNMLTVTGELTLPGSTSLHAGLNVGVEGFGAYDGTYQITSARHRLDRSSGYTTEIEIRQCAGGDADNSAGD